jgi:hypothetical protein
MAPVEAKKWRFQKVRFCDKNVDVISLHSNRFLLSAWTGTHQLPDCAVRHWTACVTKSQDTDQEGPAQHVPAVTTETVEWCAPAVLRLAWYETFSHRVDPSEPARFFIVSSFSMLRANSVSKFLLWANFLSKFLLGANLIFVSSFSLLWANFLRFEQFVCR